VPGTPIIDTIRHGIPSASNYKRRGEGIASKRTPGGNRAILDKPGGTTPEHLTLGVGAWGSGLRYLDTNHFFIASQPYGNRDDSSAGTVHFSISPAARWATWLGHAPREPFPPLRLILI
jgi:hypothetical protein